MASILITWELGSSYGHVTRLRPVAKALVNAGHAVVFAAREMKQAREVLADLDVIIVQAPYQKNRRKMSVGQTMAYADILLNCGFANTSMLNDRIWAWLGLFKLIKPDMIICDHSPTVLVAARLIDTKPVLMGSGFLCPPNHEPMISLKPDKEIQEQELITRERRVTQVINPIMRAHSLPELHSLGELFSDTDRTFLTTFEELDHFGPRPHVRYWGACHSYQGQAPAWPDEYKKRIVAYLKPTPNYEKVLSKLTELDANCLVFGTWVTPQLQRQFAGTSVSLQQEMIDFRHLSGNCDLAILNATHGSSCAMLSQGIPMLQLPTHLEQELVARRTVKIGVGLRADYNNAEQVFADAKHMLGDDSFKVAAQKVAARYQGVDSQAMFDEMIASLIKLLPA